MSNYDALRIAIIEYVEAMKAAGNVVDANDASLRLSTKYPQSGMTIDEIAERIEQAAASAGAALLSGSRSTPERRDQA